MEYNNNCHYTEITNDVRVEAWPFYVEEKSNPEKSYYFFAYKVKITNLGSKRLRLLKRYWLIRNGHGRQESIQGEGVVGQRPVLRPGESFDYTSFCPLETSTGNMRGKLQFVDAENNSFWAAVPLFFFRGPDSTDRSLEQKGMLENLIPIS